MTMVAAIVVLCWWEWWLWYWWLWTWWLWCGTKLSSVEDWRKIGNHQFVEQCSAFGDGKCVALLHISSPPANLPSVLFAFFLSSHYSSRTSTIIYEFTMLHPHSIVTCSLQRTCWHSFCNCKYVDDNETTIEPNNAHSWISSLKRCVVLTMTIKENDDLHAYTCSHTFSFGNFIFIAR